MRYLYLLIILLFISVSVQAQKYVPFRKHGALWGLDNWYDDGTHEITHYSYYIKQEKDTIIAGQIYQWLVTRTGPYGIIREDSTKHVYFYSASQQKEFLLYDFNLNLNDTLPETYNNYRGDMPNYVSTIDSVQLGGIYRKRYGICNATYEFRPFVYLIEGIGSTYGLVNKLEPPIVQGTNLECFSIDSVSIYPDAKTKCYNKITSVTEKQAEQNSIKVFPNPTTGQFTIQSQSIFSENDICVRDILGRIVLQEKIQSPNQTINISSQPKGLYFVELYCNSKRCVQKVILQ